MLERLSFAAFVLVTLHSAAGCETEGCLRGDEGCEVPSACADLSFSCDDDSVELFVAQSAADIPGGLDALGAVGDIVLRNSQVVAVIDDLNHPIDLGPSGGTLIDLSTRGDDNDAINHVVQVVGALPGDAAKFTSMRFLEGPGFVAVQVDGHLVADERLRIYTRYELRACEPGLRVRTEVINGGDDDAVWANADGYWWGGRSLLAFTPGPGAGYQHPSFGLSTLNDAFRSAPFLVAASHVAPGSALVTVGCSVDAIEGFQSGQVSAAGTPRRIVPPRDYQVFERFIGVAAGTGAQPGVDLALELRSQLRDEDSVSVSGRLVPQDGRVDGFAQPGRARVLISEGSTSDPVDARTPWTEVWPDAAGFFRARVPADRGYVLEVFSFGALVETLTFEAGDSSVDLGALPIASTGVLALDVTVDGVSDDAQVLLYPADEETKDAVTRSYFGSTTTFAPLLGPPAGGSPAGNRVLVNGPQLVDVPPGRYDVFATAGTFHTVQSATVVVNAGETVTVPLSLSSLPGLLPPGALSADFHVHGQKSFDSTLPDLDRVRAFLAANVDVIAATDHDAIGDYRAAVASLGVTDDDVILMNGLETTGHILFSFNSSVYFPQVVGHWNFWPLPFDDEAPRKGAPWDELVEPGALFERVAAAGLGPDGVIQLNHPWAELEFGRDLGFPRAIGMRLNEPLPLTFDGTGPSLFRNTPEGSAFANDDYDTQEVMNGTQNDALLQYRAVWFYFLNSGVAKVGTANSDSHALTDNILGTPRSVVFTSTTKQDFDVAAFNRDVKRGRLMGTNGPVILASLENARRVVQPSLDVVTPASDDVLRIVVRAAPWVPVREVRVVVNGAVARVFGGDDLAPDPDPSGADITPRAELEVPLAELLPAGASARDAWIVVEAGAPLYRFGDLDCDGAPDTSDNNGDGAVDHLDVDRNGDRVVDDTDLEGVDGPEACSDNYGATPDVDRPSTGPLRAPPGPGRDDEGYAFEAVTPGGFPFAFTNPFLLDRDGVAGFQGPGL